MRQHYPVFSLPWLILKAGFLSEVFFRLHGALIRRSIKHANIRCFTIWTCGVKCVVFNISCVDWLTIQIEKINME